MDVSLILAAIQASVSLWTNLKAMQGTVVNPQLDAALTTAAAAIQGATQLAESVRSVLSATDQAAVDAALADAQAQCGDDLTRVLAEIAADQ